MENDVKSSSFGECWFEIRKNLKIAALLGLSALQNSNAEHNIYVLSFE